MLSSLYLSCSVCNCCCVATSCVFTRSICCVGTNSSATWFAFRGAGALRLILSSASLLLILKSGCLNSQAYISLSVRNLTILIPKHTPLPYGDVPPSSLLCRTLWKSYLFSCRTKEAKLLCLKCFGSMCFVNFSFCKRVRAAFMPLSMRTCLQHDKAIAFIAPSHYTFVLWTLQHPTDNLLARILRTQCDSWLTCIACEPTQRSANMLNRSNSANLELTKSLELLAAWPPGLPSISSLYIPRKANALRSSLGPS